MALKLGLPAETVRDALREFKGVKRRQEVVGVEGGVTVLDDFAHHPTAIRATLEAVREAFPGGRVWAVFEPRSATSRRNTFQKDFPPSFRPADKVIVAAPFAPEKIKPEERLDVERLARDMRGLGTDARSIPAVADIIEHVAAHSRPGDVVLVMSSGGFAGIHRQLLERLRSGAP
jgi:UDP-N-acetylmuramate: L-alanyl-gamma-D-glutamyl-meso-diaminopimelate ligase